MEGRSIAKKPKKSELEDVSTFINTNLKVEFDILDEVQNNCDADLKVFTKLLSEPDLDPKTSEIISSVVDNLTLMNLNFNSIKNNIARKLYKRAIEIKTELKSSHQAEIEFEEKTKELETERNTMENDRNSLEAERDALEKERNALENKISESQGDKGKSEEKITELEKKIDETEKECNSLMTQLSEKEKKDKTEIDVKFLKDFKVYETELKKEIMTELKKWSKLKGDISKQLGNLDKTNLKSIEKAGKDIETLEKELNAQEQKLQKKTTKNRTNLEKKKKSTKQKLTKAKKQYETLRNELKSKSLEPEKVTDLKTELAQIINTIDTLEKEHNNVLKILKLHQDGLYAFFQSLPLNVNEPGEQTEDFSELLNQSLAREKKLQSKIVLTQKNVEELTKEIESMDKDYHSEVKKEYERLYKKLEDDRKKEYEEKMKSLDNADLNKIEDKYKKVLKKQDDKHKKDLELAAQRLFKLEQYISQLEQEKMEAVGAKVIAPSTSSMQATPKVVTNKDAGNKGLPMKMPKGEVPGIQAKSPYKMDTSASVANIRIAPGGSGGVATKKRTQRKKRYEAAPEAPARGMEQLAQCGACGEYIPIESDSCPNCGTSFAQEEELGACGNCGNIIPSAARKCPICGVNFE